MAIMPGMEYWDGTRAMDFVYDDGGRAEAGFKGNAGDCVCRSIAIATGRPYREIYEKLSRETGSQRPGKRGKRPASARNGINVKRKWFGDYMRSLGFEWVPTMKVGHGCKVRLLREELPMGRLVVSVSRHYTAVIDGVIHDTHDPTRATVVTENGVARLAHRCVYGYWRLVEA